MGEQLSYRQQRAVAITPKVTAPLSIPFSAMIIYEVYCDGKRNRAGPVKRILVGMSCIDILSSFAWFMSTWFVPEGNFALSAGNRGTCNFQGFLLQLAVGAPLYNCSLALFYLLIINFRWTDLMLASIEWWVHGFILSFSVGTSFLLLPLEQYNHIGAVCWIIGDPAECGDSSFQSSDVPCERGNHAWLYGVLLFYGPLWVCVLACCICMAFICVEVKRTVKRLNRYSIDGQSSHTLGRTEQESTKVALQAVLYSLSFLITWMPSTLWSIAHWFNWKAYWLDYMSSFCEPLQGLWNFFIFVRNRPDTKAKLKRFFASLGCKFCQVEEPMMTHFSTGSDSGHRGRRVTETNSSRSNMIYVVEEQPRDKDKEGLDITMDTPHGFVENGIIFIENDSDTSSSDPAFEIDDEPFLEQQQQEEEKAVFEEFKPDYFL